MLQHGVEVAPFHGRGKQANERIGPEDDKQQQRRGQHRQKSQRPCEQRISLLPVAPGEQRAPGGYEDNPQQQGAFMATPHGSNFEPRRQRTVAMLSNIDHREVITDETLNQYRKRQQQESKLPPHPDDRQARDPLPALANTRERRQRGQQAGPEAKQ